MDHLATELQKSVERWDALGWPRPQVMVVSGSGLATTELGQRLQGPLPWGELLPFTVRGIAGHPLEIELLEPLPGRVVLYSRGRLHAYQGYTPAQVVFSVRLAAQLGISVLVLTNSSGGLHPEQNTGDLVLLEDHINLSGLNPLTGSFPPSWGPQFPDMLQAYDPSLRRLLHELASEQSIPLNEGVYCSVAGPSYETPSEVRMLRAVGGDLVGMSTVLEVIAARHMGVRCAALSLISNPAAGVTDEVLDHADVLERGRQASGKFGSLLSGLLHHPDLLA